MNELSRNFQPDLAARRGGAVIAPRGAAVDVMTGAEIARCRRWSHAFAGERKDRRYYDVVEAGIRQGFDYRYFALRDAAGEVARLRRSSCSTRISAPPCSAHGRRSPPCGNSGRAS
jgi:hypothetical protein